MRSLLVTLLAMLLVPGSLFADVESKLKGKKILYVERAQYAPDHHNTATLFQKGEINTEKFDGGSAMHIYDVDSDKSITILESAEGVIRDPELSYDGKKVIFSWRKNIDDFYHIYQMNIDGSDLQQLTHAEDVSDIDPLYLADGNIVFSSTRQPKYCMCNRHIMANLFRMNPDGANVEQIGFSTLFEGHSSMLDDGRILYYRWEYIDRNFGDAQGLWTVNPDGTKHSIYYGNNMRSPGAIIDARQIPGTDLVVCIFGSCHEKPWGALAVIDRKRGVDGKASVLALQPEEGLPYLDKGNLDSFRNLEYFVEDPYPLDSTNFLVSSTLFYKRPQWQVTESKSAIFLMNTAGKRTKLIEGEKSLFDPLVIESRKVPFNIPSMRANNSDSTGVFYVQNVYEGTHMEGVEKGSVKYLRVIESPEKRTWTKGGWYGEGEQAPGVNWHSFEIKRIIGDVEVKADGSANFVAPAGKHLYFQVLDKDKKMIQSMRSGVSLTPGETNGCIGCHEDRLNVPLTSAVTPMALREKPSSLEPWRGKDPKTFSYMELVQPIFDKRCVSCHDWEDDRLVLAKDKNPFFNASYVNLYVGKHISLVGGGPADIQKAYSWGSHASRLTKIVDGVDANHNVKLTEKEREILYTWMDVNGVYYPTYESSFDDRLAGRSPLTNDQTDELAQLTGLNFAKLKRFTRKDYAMISFDRPEMSPALKNLDKNSTEYSRALQIIKEGAEVLKSKPRGDIEDEVVVHPRLQEQLKKYAARLEAQSKFNNSLNNGEKCYDNSQR